MIYSTECLEIKHICDKYGYGNVMEWASALWRLEAEKKDTRRVAVLFQLAPFLSRMNLRTQHSKHCMIIWFVTL